MAMILAFYGRWVPLEEMRVACGVSRDGTKASNLVKAARSFGLAAKCFKKEPKGLLALRWPLIIHWNFNHFLVLEGIEGDKVYLNDPANGPRAVSLDELSAAFTGVAMAFEPTEAFEKGGKPQNIRDLLARRLAGSRDAVAFAMIVSLALVLPGIAIPAFSRSFVDDVLVDKLGDDWLIPLLLGMGATALLRGGLNWLQQAILLRLEVKLAVTMAGGFMWHILQLPMTFFGQRQPGEIANRIAANDRVARMLSGDLATTVMNLTTIGFFGLVMCAYDRWLGGAAILIALCNFIVVGLLAEKRQLASRRIAVEAGNFAGVTVGAIRNVETIKAAGLEASSFERWAGVQARLLSIRQGFGGSAAVLGASPVLLESLTTAAILGIGAWRVMEGDLSIGTLVAFQSLAASFTQPIAKLVALDGTWKQVKADLLRLDDARKYATEPLTALTGPAIVEGVEQLQGEVELVEVSFGYSPLDPPLIDKLSLRLTPGKRVALVGGSGSGKSTVGRLICGLQRPWSGQILFDGRSAESIHPAARAAAITYVDQDIFLFAGTVRENLTLWDDTVPEAVLNRALADAAVFDDVALRPGQLDARVEEGGINFSGGQRQRLEIARALAVNPSILVLDEATAALDPATEKLIDDNIRRLGCTCVIIAHRLSTIRDCDEIVVLHRGRVIERGTHDQLIARDGEYASLIMTE